jgi:hypothetical protein
MLEPIKYMYEIVLLPMTDAGSRAWTLITAGSQWHSSQAAGAASLTVLGNTWQPTVVLAGFHSLNFC